MSLDVYYIVKWVSTPSFGVDARGPTEAVPCPHDARAIATRPVVSHSDDALRDWYPAAAERVIRPVDVLLCQRSSVVWGRRTHSGYAALLLALTLGWWIVGVAVGVLADLSLGEYLVGLFLPSLPAFLDASELWRAHREQADNKGLIENEIDELWATARAIAHVPPPERCREIQDRIYVTRRTGPPVPRPYYRLRRDRDERAMQSAAEQLVDGLPDHLRRPPT